MFRLGDSQGEYGLRSAISRYLYQARGVNAHPDQIIIGAGNDYLLMLLSTVIGQNHKVALETRPTSRHTGFLKVCLMMYVQWIWMRKE